MVILKYQEHFKNTHDTTKASAWNKTPLIRHEIMALGEKIGPQTPPSNDGYQKE
jgi:hypothetical protein